MTAPVSVMDDTLDVESLGTEMLAAARAAISQHGPALEDAAEFELRRLADALARIGSMFASGRITRARAEMLVAIYQHSLRSVLRSVEGLALLSADHAMDAALDVAAAVVNRIAGFKLL